MKQFIYIAILISFVSCKKSFLEIVPIGSQLAVTTDDFSKVMNDPLLYSASGTGGWAEAQLMGDEVAAETSFFINKGSIPTRDRLFQWSDTIYQPTDPAPWMLRNLLLHLYQVNLVVNGVMESTGGTTGQKNAVRGEALATRAWMHFQFVNYYCKPYVAATAGTDPGFPKVTEADVNANDFPRGTLQETYDFIINDLKEAIAGLPVKQPIQTRMSKGAAEGLLGKVYLFMGRYNDALPLLNSAMADVSAAGLTSLYDYNQTFAPGGVFLPIDVNNGPKSPGQNATDIKEAVVSKIFYSGKYGGNTTGNDGLVLTPAAAALYGPTDLRLNFYTNKNPDNSVNPSGRLRKYGVNYTRYGLQLSELYLLSAECKARTNDLGGAVTDVETLRKKRMPVADAPVPGAIAGNQTALIKFILDERLREFAMEGYRWFDMRRLSVDPLFAGITFQHTMYNADGSTIVYTLKQPNRLVMKLPPLLTDANPGIINNP